MKKITVLFVLLLSCCLAVTESSSAQSAGSVGLGLRLSPDGGGFSARFLLDRNFIVEAQLNGSMGSYYRADDGPGVAAVGLAEYQFRLPDPSWRIYLGPGLHVGSWDRYNPRVYDVYGSPQGIFGIDCIFGIEYFFRHLPIGVSADVKPAVNFARDVAFYPNNFFGLGVRYYLANKPAPAMH